MMLGIVCGVLAFPVIAVAGFLLLLTIRASKKKRYVVPEFSTNNVVIISGCDSGFGRLTALDLLDLGFHVLATTLTEKGSSELKRDSTGKKGELSVVHVDITEEESVEELVEFVEDLLQANPEKNVFGLVNNAGICIPGPVEVIPFEGFVKQIDVNLIGHVRMSQKLLPFIRKDAHTAGGRVVNLCSILGRISTPSMNAAYCCTKHAMEAISDTMRRELYPCGVSVSAIEPGFMKTPLASSLNLEKAWEGFNPDHRENYREIYEELCAAIPRLFKAAGDPSCVAQAICHALVAQKPKTRYLVGTDALIMALAAWILPDRLCDELLVML